MISKKGYLIICLLFIFLNMYATVWAGDESGSFYMQPMFGKMKKLAINVTTKITQSIISPLWLNNVPHGSNVDIVGLENMSTNKIANQSIK